MEQDAYDLPVYSHCDNIDPCSNELGDNHCVDKAQVDGRLVPLTLLPYFGPGWYGRATVAYMLDAGIITWADVKNTFNATTHRPPAYLAERLKVMEKIWLSAGETFAGVQFLEQRGCVDTSPPDPGKVRECGPLRHLKPTGVL